MLGTAGWVMTISLSINRRSHSEYQFDRKKTRLTSPKVWDSAISKAWQQFRQSFLFCYSLKRIKRSFAHRVCQDGRIVVLRSGWLKRYSLHILKCQDFFSLAFIRATCQTTCILKWRLSVRQAYRKSFNSIVKNDKFRSTCTASLPKMSKENVLELRKRNHRK